MTDGNIEILLVEHNAGDFVLAVRALRREKLTNDITMARDGEEALDVIFCRGPHSTRSFQNPPRVVLTDLKLPKVPGLEVARAIEGDPRTTAIPVVIMRSSRQERNLADSYKLGVDYVDKLVDFEPFRTKLTELGPFWVVMNQAPPARAFEPNGQDS
jgi:CheY-like chemotaxis protein